MLYYGLLLWLICLNSNKYLWENITRHHNQIAILYILSNRYFPNNSITEFLQISKIIFQKRIYIYTVKKTKTIHQQ